MRKIRNFFLSAFDNATYFERRKATYLFYIIMASLAFMVLVTLSQIVINMGVIYHVANCMALTGISLSLYFFKRNKITAAGHTLALSLLVGLGVETIVRDYFNSELEMRYRLYINLSSLLGVYFIILSFFRDKKYVLWYAVLFEIMLFAHALVIYSHVKDMPVIRMYVIEHFLTVSVGMGLVAAFCTWLLSYMEALFQQNLEYTERFKSQKEQLEKMVAERTQELQSSNKNLREFAYIVSHDLKEPLRTISGFVTLIKKELIKQGLDENEITEYIQYVTAGTRQMELLIDDILTYSNLNNVEKNFETINMDRLISSVRARLAKSIYESDCDIYLTNILPVKGDPEMLTQLFENLLSNAIKYRNNERPLKITIGCDKEVDAVRYYIQDNGIGIPEQYFDTIFKAFRRLHSKKDYEGTGVGLAICKKIVEIHGGDIGVESAEGEGSTFWFTLPLAQIEEPEIEPVVNTVA